MPNLDGEFVKCRQKRMRNAALEGRMAGIINQPERRVPTPRLGKTVCCHRRADHIVPPLDDMRRQMSDHTDVRHDVIWRHETVIGEIMSLQPGHAERRFASHPPCAGAQR